MSTIDDTYGAGKRLELEQALGASVIESSGESEIIVRATWQTGEFAHMNMSHDTVHFMELSVPSHLQGQGFFIGLCKVLEPLLLSWGVTRVICTPANRETEAIFRRAGFDGERGQPLVAELAEGSRMSQYVADRATVG